MAAACLDRIESAVRRTESLAGFYWLGVEERRMGSFVSAFFHSKTELELIDSQAHLQMLRMEWGRIKAFVDLSRVGKEQFDRICSLELRMQSALNHERDNMPRRDL
jgi:hypothetical protein